MGLGLPGSCAGVARGRMGAGGDEISDRLSRVVLLDQSFADEHGVGACRGVREQVVRAADTALRDLDGVIREKRGDAGEGLAVDIECAQVARVDADDAGTRVSSTSRFFFVV